LANTWKGRSASGITLLVGELKIISDTVPGYKFITFCFSTHLLEYGKQIFNLRKSKPDFLFFISTVNSFSFSKILELKITFS
jgi:hypothetical protein